MTNTTEATGGGCDYVADTITVGPKGTLVEGTDVVSSCSEFHFETRKTGPGRKRGLEQATPILAQFAGVCWRRSSLLTFASEFTQILEKGTFVSVQLYASFRKDIFARAKFIIDNNDSHWITGHQFIAPTDRTAKSIRQLNS